MSNDIEQDVLTADEDNPTADKIRRRAYEISESGQAGTPEENWQRAETEIRAESDQQQKGA